MKRIFEGKIAEILFETGYHFKIYYLPDNKMKFISLKKDENFGYTETEDVIIDKISENIYAISWVESTGLTVTQNIDLSKMSIYAVMTWHDDSKYGNRFIMSHRGTYKFINDNDILI